jgi:hypothetical protein
MAWIITTPQAGFPEITDTSSTQGVALGTIVTGRDETYGGGEFIYLKGAANTVAGLLVSYDPVRGNTTLSPNSTAQTRPLAVAMSANVANQYGWYQIGGVASIKKIAIAVTPAVALYQSSTTGRVTSAAASGKQFQSCISANSATVASATSTVLVVISRPTGQGVTGL